MVDKGMIAGIEDARAINAPISRHIDDDDMGWIRCGLRDHDPQMSPLAIPKGVARFHTVRRPVR
jgi:hypothetical protein